jgi:hypothetical protein
MRIIVNRQYFLQNCTIGQITVQYDDVPVYPIYVCDSLEPHAIDWSKEKKIKDKTAIPCGEYELKYSYSGKFAKEMPYLQNVPHFEGVMIHTGNRPCDTHGCILVGENPRNLAQSVMPKLINSRIKFSLLEKFLYQAIKKKEKITVVIKEDRRQ